MACIPDLIEAATQANLTEPDWAFNKLVSHHTKSSNAWNTMRLIKDRLQSRQSQTIYLALTVLHTCMVECPFIAELAASRDFLQWYIQQLVALVSSGDCYSRAAEYGVQALQYWGTCERLAAYPVFREVYEHCLDTATFEFPEEVDAGALYPLMVMGTDQASEEDDMLEEAISFVEAEAAQLKNKFAKFNVHVENPETLLNLINALGEDMRPLLELLDDLSVDHGVRMSRLVEASEQLMARYQELKLEYKALKSEIRSSVKSGACFVESLLRQPLSQHSLVALKQHFAPEAGFLKKLNAIQVSFEKQIQARRMEEQKSQLTGHMLKLQKATTDAQHTAVRICHAAMKNAEQVVQDKELEVAAATADAERALEEASAELQALRAAKSQSPAAAVVPITPAALSPANDAELKSLREKLATTKSALEQANSSVAKLESAAAASRQQIADLQREVANRDEKLRRLDSMDPKSEMARMRWVCEWRQAASVLAVRASRAAAEQATQAAKDAERAREEAVRKYLSGLDERRALHNQIMDLKGNLRVFCRVRPMDPPSQSAVSVEENKVLVAAPGEKKPKVFTFDAVFGPSSTQDDIFAETRLLVVSALDGFDVCIFAYGQTGSGKTFTMEGTPAARGVSYRALEELFKLCAANEIHCSYELHIGMVEIYNDEIRDLMPEPDRGGRPPRLEIRSTQAQTRGGGPGSQLPDQLLVPIRSLQDVESLLSLGASHRATASTQMNNLSSRSHLVLTIHCTTTNLTSGVTTRGRLNLIDLAGSERVARSGVTEEQFLEAQHINKSLLCLGEVLAALAAQRSHVPYRNSKLTHVLQDSLGSSAKTVMFVMANPAVENMGETICSLNFAARANEITLGQAKRNVSDGPAAGKKK